MSIEMKIGSKVVCIRGNWGSRSLFGTALPIDAPVKGSIYTIRDFRETLHAPGELFLVLNECSAVEPDGKPSGWLSTGFRPLTSTGISICMEAVARGLRGEPVEELVDV